MDFLNSIIDIYVYIYIYKQQLQFSSIRAVQYIILNIVSSCKNDHVK